MKLSAIVITRNEEKNIQRCLTSLVFADEIIVVDAESSDRTAALARQAGARVIQRPWPGYGSQKNFGANQASGEWLLFIDADEVVSPELAQEILAIIKNHGVDFYWLKIVTVFLGNPLPHLTGHNPRLFKKRAGQWTNSPVHEQVERNADRVAVSEFKLIKLDDRFSTVLQQPLLHYSHPTISSYLATMHRYTSLDAQQMSKTGRHRSGRPVTPSIWLPWHLSSRQFLKLAFYRRGLLDGLAGLIWCLLSSYYEWEMAKKFNHLCE